ncbi:hypothetical protein HY091_01790 [Candidatus Kaiserbacteria bacterium]|nr:hypothetical protein [Candidatus Kaiserbacteria bacterium]
MPLNKSSPRPKVMTWKKALPILALAGIFDAIRFAFEQFWLFGPILVGTATNSFFGGGAIGGVAGSIAGKTSFLAGPELEVFGIVMAAVVGLAGWGTIGFLLLVFNQRFFKANASNTLWFLSSLVVSEIPIVGSVPALFAATFKGYHSQIKREKAALKRWEKERTEMQKRNRDARLAEQYAAAEQNELAEAIY